MALLHLKKTLESQIIVLASGSPSRAAVMKDNLGLNVTVVRSEFEEDFKQEDFPNFSEYVEETANGKVQEVADRMRAKNIPFDIIIGADTIVGLGDQLLLKPKSEDEAYQTLSRLSGNMNTVYTGVIILTKDGVCVKFTDTTNVYFRELSEEQIRAYVKSGEPMTVAGSYKIQGIGGSLIEKIEGNYFTVLGLPIHRLSVELTKLIQ